VRNLWHPPYSSPRSYQREAGDAVVAVFSVVMWALIKPFRTLTCLVALPAFTLMVIGSARVGGLFHYASKRKEGTPPRTAEHHTTEHRIPACLFHSAVDG
jgi:hypothetical protein